MKTFWVIIFRRPKMKQWKMMTRLTINCRSSKRLIALNLIRMTLIWMYQIYPFSNLLILVPWLSSPDIPYNLEPHMSRPDILLLSQDNRHLIWLQSLKQTHILRISMTLVRSKTHTLCRLLSHSIVNRFSFKTYRVKLIAKRKGNKELSLVWLLKIDSKWKKA